MKNIIFAAAALLFTSTAVYADGFGFGGYGQYAIESEHFEMGLNADYQYNEVTLYTEAVFALPNGESMDFDSMTFGVAYQVNDNLDLFAEVDVDEDFEYNETTVGLSVNF